MTGEEGRQAWADLFWITSNWANTETLVGNLDLARQRNLECVEIGRKAGIPALGEMTRELEVLRIDIQQGKVAEALPEIESRLAQIESWWRQYRSGTLVKEAGTAEHLFRGVMSALDIANSAHRARGDWASALRISDSRLRIVTELERPAREIAAVRMNRSDELTHLGRFEEVRAELEGSLEIFEEISAHRAKLLSSLGLIFERQGDFREAANQASALAICNQLPDPEGRAACHSNIALCLVRTGDPDVSSEADRHRLAALIYCSVSGFREYLHKYFAHYIMAFRLAAARGMPPSVPRVSELVIDPMFHPLSEWLRQRNVDLDELQAQVDGATELLKERAANPDANQSPGSGELS
jgi:hypothetical protein